MLEHVVWVHNGWNLLCAVRALEPIVSGRNAAKTHKNETERHVKSNSDSKKAICVLKGDMRDVNSSEWSEKIESHLIWNMKKTNVK